MKNKLEHIDKIFLEGAADDAANFSAKKGWRMMKLRLLLSEIMAFNFVNVNWNYLIFTGIFLLLFSFSFIYFNRDGDIPSKISKTISTATVLPETERNNKQTMDESSRSKTDKDSDNQASRKIVPVKNGRPVQTAQNNPIKKRQERINKIKQPSIAVVSDANGIDKVHPKKYSLQLSVPEEPSATATRKFQADLVADQTEEPFAEKQEKDPSPFLLGFNAGSVFLLNESNPVEEIQKPILFAGLNLRYSRAHFYFETAIEFSSYASTINTTYRYDSAVGTIAASGYDIVEVTNDDGETVLERQYHSELITIYDTLSSNDEVAINSHSAVLCVPLRIGTKLFQHGKFYAAVYTGAALKILLLKNQSLPEFGTENREIIAYETNPVTTYEPEFYFQGGLLFGCDISKRFSLEIRSSYNHILGGNSNMYQPSKSTIKAGIGLNYKF